MCALYVLTAQAPALMYVGAAVSVFLIFLFYVPMNMLYAYCLSFAFDKMETAQTVIPNLFVMVSRQRRPSSPTSSSW